MLRRRSFVRVLRLPHVLSGGLLLTSFMGVECGRSGLGVWGGVVGFGFSNHLRFLQPCDG